MPISRALKARAKHNRVRITFDNRFGQREVRSPTDVTAEIRKKTKSPRKSPTKSPRKSPPVEISPAVKFHFKEYMRKNGVDIAKATAFYGGTAGLIYHVLNRSNLDEKGQNEDKFAPLYTYNPYGKRNWDGLIAVDDR